MTISFASYCKSGKEPATIAKIFHAENPGSHENLNNCGLGVKMIKCQWLDFRNNFFSNLGIFLISNLGSVTINYIFRQSKDFSFGLVVLYLPKRPGCAKVPFSNTVLV